MLSHSWECSTAAHVPTPLCPAALVLDRMVSVAPGAAPAACSPLGTITTEPPGGTAAVDLATLAGLACCGVAWVGDVDSRPGASGIESNETFTRLEGYLPTESSSSSSSSSLSSSCLADAPLPVARVDVVGALASGVTASDSPSSPSSSSSSTYSLSKTYRHK